MKKLLALTACTALTANSLAVVGCSTTAKYSTKLMDEYANIAGYAARPGILSTQDNLDPAYTFQHYGAMSAHALMPQYFGADDKSTLNTAVDQVFGEQTNSKFTEHNAADAGINFNGKRSPGNPATRSDLKLIQLVLGVISKKIPPSSIATLANLLASPNFSSVLKSLHSLGVYTNSQFLTAMGNVFHDIKTEYVTQTYEQVMQSAKIVFANFLNSFSQKPGDFLNDKLDDVAKNVQNLQTADTLIQNSLINIISGKTTDQVFNALFSANGLPNLIKLVLILSNYIEAFNNSPNSSLVLNNTTKGYDSDHLFSATQTNFQVKEAVLKSKFKPANLDLQEGARLLQLFLGVDSTKDPNGFNMLKVLNILFDNKESDSIAVGEPLPNLAISYDQKSSDRTWGFDQIWINIIYGLYKGIVQKEAAKMGKISSLVIPILNQLVGKIASFIYKPVYDIANNASWNKDSSDNYNNFWEAFIGKPGAPSFDKWFQDQGGLLGVMKSEFPLIKLGDPKLIPTLTLVRSYILKVQKAFTGENSPLYNKEGVFVGLYNGGTINNTLKWVDSLFPNLIPATTAKTLADIKTIETEPLKNILKLIGVALPDYLYVSQDMSVNSAVNAFASEFGVKDRYQKASYTDYQIDTKLLSKMFLALGLPADQSIKASNQNIPSSVNTDQGVVKASASSTLNYALTLLANNDPSNPNSGAHGAFELLGLVDNHKGATASFWKKSVFDNLSALYDPNNTEGVPKILSDLLAGVNNILANMQKQEKQYLKYFDNNAWKLDPKTITIQNTSTKRTITFNEAYTDPDTKKTTTYQISFYLSLVDQNQIFQWNDWKKVG